MKSVRINVSLASIYEGLKAGLPGEGEFIGVQLSRDHQTLEIVYASELIKHPYDFPVDVDVYKKLPAELTAESPTQQSTSTPQESIDAGKPVRITKRKPKTNEPTVPVV